MHVDDIFAVRLKNRCDILCDDLLIHQILVKNLGELKCYGGCHYSRDRERGTLTISHENFRKR